MDSHSAQWHPETSAQTIHLAFLVLAGFVDHPNSASWAGSVQLMRWLWAVDIALDDLLVGWWGWGLGFDGSEEVQAPL